MSALNFTSVNAVGCYVGSAFELSTLPVSASIIPVLLVTTVGYIIKKKEGGNRIGHILMYMLHLSQLVYGIFELIMTTEQAVTYWSPTFFANSAMRILRNCFAYVEIIIFVWNLVIFIEVYMGLSKRMSRTLRNAAHKRLQFFVHGLIHISLVIVIILVALMVVINSTLFPLAVTNVIKSQSTTIGIVTLSLGIPALVILAIVIIYLIVGFRQLIKESARSMERIKDNIHNSISERRIRKIQTLRAMMARVGFGAYFLGLSLALRFVGIVIFCAFQVTPLFAYTPMILNMNDALLLRAVPSQLHILSVILITWPFKSTRLEWMVCVCFQCGYLQPMGDRLKKTFGTAVDFDNASTDETSSVAESKYTHTTTATVGSAEPFCPEPSYVLEDAGSPSSSVNTSGCVLTDQTDVATATTLPIDVLVVEETMIAVAETVTTKDDTEPVKEQPLVTEQAEQAEPGNVDTTVVVVQDKDVQA